MPETDLVRSIAAIARSEEIGRRDFSQSCEGCGHITSRVETTECSKCGKPLRDNADSIAMGIAVRMLGRAYAKNPEQVNLALLEASAGAINAKLYHDRIACMHIEHERRVADEAELGTFFRLQFQREIEQGMHAGKTTNEVIMAYLWKYYLRPRDSWWGRMITNIFGSGWGI